MFILEQQWDDKTVRVGWTHLRAMDECDATLREGHRVTVPDGMTGILVAMKVPDGKPQAEPFCFVQTAEGIVFECFGNGLEVV